MQNFCFPSILPTWPTLTFVDPFIVNLGPHATDIISSFFFIYKTFLFLPHLPQSEKITTIFTMAEYAPGTPRVIGQYVRPFCKCGHRLTVKTAWTPENPGKRFIACPDYVSPNFLLIGFIFLSSLVLYNSWGFCCLIIG